MSEPKRTFPVAHFISFLDSGVNLPAISVTESAARQWLRHIEESFPRWKVVISDVNDVIGETNFPVRWYRVREVAS